MSAQRKKRILYVITKSNLGGAQRYVLELATGVPKDDYEVAVAFGGSGLLRDELEHAGIRTYPITHLERDINMAKEFRSLIALGHIVRDFRPDIVHLNSSKAGGSGALVARLCGVKHIMFTAHGWAFNEQRGFLWRSIVWILSWITALLVHTIIVVSAYDRKRMHMPFTKGKSVIIPTAVPPFTLLERIAARHALFTERECRQHEHDLWLVTIAELTPNKNLRAAIDAIAAFNATHTTPIYYSIMGDGELMEELQTHIRTHHLEHAVKLLGFVRDARTHLHAYDAFLLPSQKEGMPYAILEAGHAGLPVVASNVGGIPEVIEEGVTGFLFDPTIPESLTYALAELTTQSDRRARCAAALQKRVHEHFSLSHMIEDTVRAYTRR